MVICRRYWCLNLDPLVNRNRPQITLEFFPCEPAIVRLLFGNRVVQWPIFASPFPSPSTALLFHCSASSLREGEGGEVGHSGTNRDIFRRKIRKIAPLSRHEEGISRSGAAQRGEKTRSLTFLASLPLRLCVKSLLQWMVGSTFPFCFFARMRLPRVSLELPEVRRVQRRGGGIPLALE